MTGGFHQNGDLPEGPDYQATAQQSQVSGPQPWRDVPMTRCLAVYITLTLLLVALFAGCKQQTGPAAPTAPVPAPTTVEKPEHPATTAQYRIAVVPKGTAHIFWKSVKAGAEAAAQELNAEILWNGPEQETDIEGQKRILENFVSQKVDAIVMAACDADGLIPTVKQAAQAGIPTVTIDSGLSDPEASVCYIATDNVEGGRKAGDKLAELIGEQGAVGLIPFIKGAASSDQRQQGFEAAMDKYPRIKIVSTLFSESDPEIAQRVTEDMITAHPDLAGIFAANEPAGVAAARVIKERGLSGKVKLVAFDSSESEIAALREGTIQALIVQNPFKMGYEGVKTAIAHLQGKPVAKTIDTGVTVITKDTMDQPDMMKLLNPLEAAAPQAARAH